MEKAIKSNFLENIKSVYILKKVVDNILPLKLLSLIKYNRKNQNKLDIGINDYIKYYQRIKIEIIPFNKKEENIFINFPEENETFYHIYFNDNKNEIKRNYFTNEEKIKKIIIYIDKEINSLDSLFEGCDCIEKINFIKFNRDNITDMKNMFL